ncbi:MAG: toll/interleukin-1 receptor domain-containing protein, partial [Acidobacteriota bacterium]
KWYVPCLWEIDLDRSLFNRALPRHDFSEQDYQIFLKHLEFKGHGSFGNIIEELRQPTTTRFDSEAHFIDVSELAKRDEVRHNAWMQDLLKLNWKTILGGRFSGRDRSEKIDRARIGVYLLVDWLAGRSVFSREELVKVSQSSPVTISDDLETVCQTINNLLHVLIKNDYLILTNDRYRIVWQSDDPPTIRKVKPFVANQILEPQSISANVGKPSLNQASLLARPQLTDQAATSLIPARTISVFVSYSHKDAKYLKQNSLMGFLSGLTLEGFEFWHDERISAADLWDERIRDQIKQSDIALLLISQWFLTSFYCMNVEVEGFLKSRAESGLKIFPIIISPCDWKSHQWLTSTQSEPRFDQTIETHYKNKGKRDQLFLRILEEVRRLGREIRARH